MKQEEKELLIQDLCGRLPYNIKVQYEGDIFNIDYISSIYGEIHLDIVDNYTIDVSEVKPCLFPLSSMTEEQEREYSRLHTIIFSCFEDDLCEALTELQDFYNKYHLDYRGLIPTGLAIDATNLNIY